MKRVLITGKNSYSGKKFMERLFEVKPDWVVESISVRNNDWMNEDFSRYDAIYHVAAIVHQKEDVSRENEYYRVNSELPLKLALKAKTEGVRSFVFLSSIAVYGIVGEIKSTKGITKETTKDPQTLNGKSKLLAERNLKELNDDEFKVSLLRVPLIYGENSPGNYSSLLKLSKMLPIFPKVNNTRSMIHIDRLSDIVMHLIDSELQGVFLVNDQKNINTSLLFKALRTQQKKKTYLSKLLGKCILTFGKEIPLIKKLFGSMYFDLKDTKIPGFEEEKI
ncbi:NAD-dependent epimerase/dehydratase family protein [Planococcus sp. CP5-4]|nr:MULTISPECIES: NAD-dependent epimerase/dehydratase family protein [unclassified Planococcus (in: firmicutes)]MBW6062117.1 NAD-dependent epimerase/dehydratase family protein [Planococcus sp. CP5-4]